MANVSETRIAPSIGASIISWAPGFAMHGLLIENPSGWWLLIQPGNYWVPPYTFGWRQSLDGINAVSISSNPGPGNLVSSNTGQPFIATAQTESVSDTAGYTTLAPATIDHNALVNVTPNQHHAQAHDHSLAADGQQLRPVVSGGVSGVHQTRNMVEGWTSSRSLITLGENAVGDANPAATFYRTASGFDSGRGMRIYNPQLHGFLFQHSSGADVAYGSETYTTDVEFRLDGIVQIGPNGQAGTALARDNTEFWLGSKSLITTGESAVGDGNPRITFFRTSGGLEAGAGMRIGMPSSIRGLIIEHSSGTNTAYGSETWTTDVEFTHSGTILVGPEGSQVAAGFVISGMIMLWHGTVATIPAGWFLCDGANGTPDLRDRFIIGAASGNENTSGGTVSASAALATHAAHTHDSHTSATTSSASSTISVTSGAGNSVPTTAHTHTVTATPVTHASQPGGTHAIMNFYRLCYIMKS